jgi:adenine-specific DNA-methyltransferase
MTMDRLKMHSVNKVDENIKKIAELFPNTLTEVIKGYRKDGTPIIEHAIDFDVLRQELADIIVEGPEERYQFTWPDKKKSILLANAPIAKTLRPCREESVDFDTTENLYIEGDNLDVLKLLQETYLGKVKMIYIDPPYNTGNDLIYEDDFAQSAGEYLANSGQFDENGNRLVLKTESNGRFHTDWLNMMYPRLKLAKDLLSDDGVIFISIDDNEQANIKKVCDEIFGESNCIGPIIQNKLNAKNDTLNIQKNHEFILIYRKSCIYANGSRVLPTLINKEFKAREIFEDNGEFYYINDTITTRGEGGTLNARPNLGYTVYYNPKTKDKIAVCDYNVDLAKTSNDINEVYITDMKLVSQGYIPIRPPKVRGRLGCWTWSLEKFNNNKHEIVITGREGSYSVKKRTFVDAKYVKNINGKLIYNSYTEGNSKSILDFSTNEGTNALNEVLGIANTFNNPKNLTMMIYLLKLVPDSNAIILDFFSGSATTAHAVMQLNAEDGGNRKFIMVQLPEPCDEKSEAYKAGYKTVAEIGKERIRRAGRKILEEHPEAAGKLDIGFRVLKVDSTNMQDVYYRPEEYTQELLLSLTDNIKPDRTPEDLLFQVMLDLGVLLSSKIEEIVISGKKMFIVADGYLMACFDNEVTGEVVREIAKKQPYYAVFRDSGIANDSVAANFEQIFATYSPSTIRKVL